MRRVNRNVTWHQGSSLVEVLVSMFLVSVGMLGIVSLFIHDLINTRSALLRTQAIALLNDMADRIRANAGGRDAYDTSTYGGLPALQSCTPSDVTTGSNCSTAQQAQDDLASWTAAVRRALPGLPTAVVEYSTGDPAKYRLALTWREPGESQPFSALSEVIIEAAP